jgi:hypothetical protein
MAAIPLHAEVDPGDMDERMFVVLMVFVVPAFALSAALTVLLVARLQNRLYALEKRLAGLEKLMVAASGVRTATPVPQR